MFVDKMSRFAERVWVALFAFAFSGGYLTISLSLAWLFGLKGAAVAIFIFFWWVPVVAVVLAVAAVYSSVRSFWR